MTDRHSGYVVTLAQDIREDDAYTIVNALRMVRGVIDVTPILGDFDITIAKARCNVEWREALIKMLDGMEAR